MFLSPTVPSPKLSPKMPPKLSLPHKRGLFNPLSKLLGRTFTRLTRVSLVTRVTRRFFWGPHKHGKISRKSPERPFFHSAPKSGCAKLW